MHVSILISIVALFLSGYTFYFSFIRPCKIDVYVGDKIGIVKSSGGDYSKVHLNCNFVNNTPSNGVIDKILLEIEAPDKKKYQFDWDEYYKYVGNQGVEPESLSFPIAINSKNSVYKGIQFKMRDHSEIIGSRTVSETSISWTTGKYTLTIKGWSNKSSINEKPNIIKLFQIDINAIKLDEITHINAGEHAMVVFIPLSGWDE